MSAAAAVATPAEVLEKHERREARDSYRRAGGSKSRPLKSFTTDREKREARDAHAARIHAAVDELADERGFEAWIEAMALNPQLSPMNAALVALQSPGEIVGTAASWRKQGYKVRKGERCAGRITAPQFWPLAYFTAEQASATDLLAFEPELPDAEMLGTLRAALSALLAGGEKARLALEAVAEAVESPEKLAELLANSTDVEQAEPQVKDSAETLNSEDTPAGTEVQANSKERQVLELERAGLTPAEKLADIAGRRALIERERKRIEQEIRELVGEQIVTAREAAEAMGVSRQRIYQLAEAA